MGPPIPAPLSWDDVVNIVEDGSMEQLVRLGRSAAQLAVYVAFLQQVSQEYASVSDMIRVRVLGWTPTQGPDGKKVAVDPAPAADGAAVLKVWSKNDFPYWFHDGVEHDVLWSTAPLPPAEIEATIAQRLPGRKAAYFVNPPPLQSVGAVR